MPAGQLKETNMHTYVYGLYSVYSIHCICIFVMISVLCLPVMCLSDLQCAAVFSITFTAGLTAVNLNGKFPGFPNETAEGTRRVLHSACFRLLTSLRHNVFLKMHGHKNEEIEERKI